MDELWGCLARVCLSVAEIMSGLGSGGLGWDHFPWAGMGSLDILGHGLWLS